MPPAPIIVWPRPASPVAPLPRRVAAALLRRASRALSRLAHRLGAPAAAPAARPLPLVEFHAEAGAPEGALYVDGQLVGWLDGVRRL